MPDGLRVEVDDAVATLTLDRPEALNALTVPLKEALARGAPADRRRPVGPRGDPDRCRAGVLRRPGPRRARAAGRGAARRGAARALQPDHPDAARDGPAGDRGGERRRGRGRGVTRVRLRPADRGGGRPVRAGLRADRAGARIRGRPGSCPGSWARRGPPSWRWSAIRSPPTRRCGSGWSTGSCRGESLLAEARALADRLAASSPDRARRRPRPRSSASWSLDLDGALDEEARLQGLAGATADHAEGLAAFREKRPPRFTGE